MSDDKPRDTPQAPRPDDETQPVRADGPPADEPAAAPAPEPAAPAPAPALAAPTERRGFRDRLRRVRTSEGNRAYSLGALIASGLAGVIVGGLGAAALHAVTDGPHDRGPWVQRWDDEHGPGFGGHDGMHGGPRGVPGGGPGRMLPTTPPEEQGSSS